MAAVSNIWVGSWLERTMRRTSAAHPGVLLVSITPPLVALDGTVVRLMSCPRYVLLALAAASPGLVSEAELLDLIYGDRADGGPVALGVYIVNARAAAAALGLRIENHFGRGFSLRRIATEAA